MSDLEADLRGEVAKGRVAVIVGAGVSMQATDRSPCASWQGLLRHGAARAAEVDAEFLAKRLAIVEQEIATGDLDNLLGAAEKIARALGAPGGGEYRRWLRESVGALPLVSREALEALRDLGLVLATTNYDGLLEKVTGLDAVSWRESAAVERVLRGDERAIVHLHGYWKEPESVVLGIRSYEQVIGDEHAQMMLRGLRLKSSLLFVGCGAGLEDPNFEQFRAWLGRVLAGSEYRSFRLATEGELGELRRVHAREERLFVLPYGKQHSELAGYLRGLRPSAPRSAPAAGRRSSRPPQAPSSAPPLEGAPRIWTPTVPLAGAPNGVAALLPFGVCFRVGEVLPEGRRRLALQIGPAAEQA